MQTLDCVSGSHNFPKFSQPPFVFRWEYVNTEKGSLLLKQQSALNEVVIAYLLSLKKNHLLQYNSIRKLFHGQIILALANFYGSTY